MGGWIEERETEGGYWKTSKTDRQEDYQPINVALKNRVEVLRLLCTGKSSNTRCWRAFMEWRVIAKRRASRTMPCTSIDGQSLCSSRCALRSRIKGTLSSTKHAGMHFAIRSREQQQQGPEGERGSTGSIHINTCNIMEE